jgi:parallel beta-helix repeat protein
VRGDLGNIYMADQTDERPVELTDASGSAIHGLVIQRAQAAPEPHLKLVASSGVLIEGNTLRGAGSRAALNDGIFVDAASHDVTIRNNAITLMGHDGVHLESSGNLVTGNLINGNSEGGIFVGGTNNLLEGNKVGGNLGAGLFFNTAGGPHVFRNNVLRGNATAVGGPYATANTDAGGNVP